MSNEGASSAEGIPVGRPHGVTAGPPNDALSKIRSSRLYKSVTPFLVGGVSGCVATTLIQPVDTVKVRLQSGAAGGAFSVARGVVRTEGVAALWRGIDAGWLRQITYTTARLGLFRVFCDALSTGEPLPFTHKAAAGLAAGGLGALVGNPADLALVRLQADTTLPAAQRRHYKNAWDALRRIAREEGVRGLWAGCTPTVLRAMTLNAGMLATNAQAKEALAPLGAAPAALGAAALSGWAAATVSLPFDMLKTRLQRQVPVNGALPYRGVLHAMAKIARTEGPLVFYKGYWTYYARIAPHAVATLICMDLLNRIV